MRIYLKEINIKLSPAKWVMEKEVENQHYKNNRLKYACGVQAFLIRKPKASIETKKLFLAVLPRYPHRRAGDLLDIFNRRIINSCYPSMRYHPFGILVSS